MRDNEAYRAQLRALAISMQGTLPTERLDMVKEMIDANEGGEALITLAWTIVESGVMVPSSVIRELREQADDLVAPGDLPANLDAHGS